MTPGTPGESPPLHTLTGRGDVDDSYLMKSVVGGDPAALRALMARYDRLVRHTVFQAARQRSRKDPEWLESMATATWAGFVQSLNRSAGQQPSSAPSYLVRIARNQVASSLRKKQPLHESIEARDVETIQAANTETADPLAMLSAAEDLEALRTCLKAVGRDDQTLLAHLEGITERRWKDVASDLGLPESTLRSRWQRLLDRLRDCVEGKTGKSFALREPDGD